MPDPHRPPRRARARGPLISALLLLSCAACAAQAPGRVSLGSALGARIVGRYLLEPAAPGGAPAPRCARLAWSGTQIEARFRGPEVVLHLGQAAAARPDAPGSRYAVRLDGRALPDLVLEPGGRRRHVIASRLAPTEHLLQVVRRSEAHVGEARLCGVEAPQGTLLPPPGPRARLIAIVGDSISVGYGVHAADAHAHFSVADEDACATYGALAAAELGADVHIVGWSGRGLWRNGDGSQLGTVPQLWARTLPEEPDAPWQPTGRPPDAIVINLGTNDVRAGALDEDAFVARYTQFLRTLRRSAPEAHLLVAVGPMLSDGERPLMGQLTQMRRLAQQVVAEHRRALDARVHALVFPEQDGRLGFGADYHPSAQTQAMMGTQLALALRATLGW